MRIPLIVFLAASILFPLTAYGVDVFGPIWGTWTKENSPYNVVSGCRIPPESTLVIEPGVVVNFKGHYKFNVDSMATLLAVGTQTDSICFTAEDTAVGWWGIRFWYADSNSQLSYCCFEYGKAIRYLQSRYGWRGGAIMCLMSNPTISNNTFTHNWAAGKGGAICCDSLASPTISHNTIAGNSAKYGGAICCLWDSNAKIIANTITANSATHGGGGIYINESQPVITNSILWENTAPIGQQIKVNSGPDPVVTYSDVQGGWQGEGNIDADPLFVGPQREDFILRWRSPCIDAGDPFLTDPDGTRSDIGAFYFDQAVLGIVEVYPHEEPIVIPPGGGEIIYDGGILNRSGGDLTVDIWAQAFVPGLSQPYRLWRYNDVTIPFGGRIFQADLVEQVPGYVPSGDYSFVIYIGDFPSSIIDSSYFYFTKEGGGYTNGAMHNWLSLNGWFSGDLLSEDSHLPSRCAVGRNHPNPFNANTTINYQLPADATVKLEVFNTLGQKIATLADGKQQAGYRSVTWNASEVSSGIYFYKLTAGDFTETKRMTLVK
jgi:predicted outer membrane repeat protein